MQRSALCRSRRELSNAYFLAKFGLDTAENEPCQVCPIPRNAAASEGPKISPPGRATGCADCLRPELPEHARGALSDLRAVHTAGAAVAAAKAKADDGGDEERNGAGGFRRADGCVRVLERERESRNLCATGCV